MPTPEGSSKPDLFVQTRWTLIQRAHASDTAGARTALAELCQTYWQPLYAYVRRSGCSPHDAEDLTQGFFERLLRLDSLAGVRREEGKFRAFLLASLKHFLADQRDFASAQKRDARLTLSLDADTAEQRYLAVPAGTLTPDQVYERQWAMTLLETVMQRLAREYEESARGGLFAALRFAIAGEKSALPYADLAARLGMSEEAVRVAIHRLRQRYRAALREELAHTVTSDAEVHEELRELRRILSR
jgi:RNA polymerase sigma-70 factor (ECF subfamily)